MCKVSIIVPIYNEENTLERCLNSLHKQTFSDYEVLLINDGSTDSSLEICEKYEKLDERFKIFSRENAGPSAARNLGIDRASGEFIYFVDADDHIEHTAIEKMYDEAKYWKADVTICGFYRITDKKIKIHEYPYARGLHEGESCRRIAIDLLDNMSPPYLPPYAWIRMIRADVLKKHHLRFAEKVKRNEDYLFATELHFRIDRLFIIDEPLYNYIESKDSITINYVRDYWSMARHIYHELFEKLPREAEIFEKLDLMLIKRSLLAFNNACRNKEKDGFKNEISEIISDEELRQAVENTPFSLGFKKAGAYFLLMRMKLYGLVKWRYSLKRKINHKKDHSYENY
ncbi:MAG: glycosyltransferase [Fastidiosipila sp.]|nr:glycosyltransferase [Fastidiosipila sp.]